MAAACSQALAYAEALDVPFAFASNGDRFMFLLAEDTRLGVLGNPVGNTDVGCD